MPAIKPEEAVKAKERIVPEFVFEAFNRRIVETIHNNRAEFTQESVISIILATMPNNHPIDDMPETSVIRNQIYDEGWLNIEDVYREAGWKVEYDKPGYNETYNAFFVFTAP